MESSIAQLTENSSRWLNATKVIYRTRNAFETRLSHYDRSDWNFSSAKKLRLSTAL